MVIQSKVPRKTLFKDETVSSGMRMQFFFGQRVLEQIEIEEIKAI